MGSEMASSPDECRRAGMGGDDDSEWLCGGESPTMDEDEGVHEDPSRSMRLPVQCRIRGAGLGGDRYNMGRKSKD